MAKLLGKIFYKQILITFDLADQPMQEKLQTRLKDLMLAKGYMDYMIGTNSKGENGKSLLPCRSLCKKNIDPKEAKADLRDAAKSCGAIIERCIAVEIMEWSGMSVK